ncbi:MAG TPA: shikimate dehydrogenase [Bacteroidales bacterium]|nr:shikimate dehydrogenase [Bacteroidales bacterium]
MRLLRVRKTEKALYGLIGYPLGHSFSKAYFNEKFEREGINAEYENFPMPDLDALPQLIEDNPRLKGLNVTIPHKQSILTHLTYLDRTAKLVGSVNTFKILRSNNKITLIGYNTDVIGFVRTFDALIEPNTRNYALILGSGGGAKAVKYVLRERGIFFRSVSTKKQKTDQITYEMLNKALLDRFNIIINTTPVGMYPNIDDAPKIPYEYIKPTHTMIDLVYNPEETLFLKYGRERGARTMNGLMMLHAQAEAAWQIWKKPE